MRHLFFLLFALILISCDNKSDKGLSDKELDKEAQVFSTSDAVFCRNPWVEGYNSNAKKLGLKPSTNKYGESSDELIGWVKFKLKLVIPPVGKSLSNLESNFTYSAENCWGDTNREGYITFSCSIENIINNSNLENEYLVSSKDGDTFDAYIENPTFSLKTPSHACDIAGITISAPGRVYFTPKFK